MASNYSMSQFDSLNANQQNEIRRIATENANDTAARDTKINDVMKLYTTPAPAPAPAPVPLQNQTTLDPLQNQSSKMREADDVIQTARQQVQQYDASTVSDGTGNTVQVQQGAPAPATPAQYPTVQNANIDNKAPQASGTSTTQTPSPSASKTQQPEPPKVLTQDEVFNSVLSGTALPDNVKRSPLYREVMKRKSNVDMVNAMSAEDLVLAEKAGSISGSALNDLRLVNPAKYAQFTQVKERRTKMDQINTTTNAGFNIVSGGLTSNVSAAQQYADAVTASIRKTEEEGMAKLKAMRDEVAKKGEEYEQKFLNVVRNDPSIKDSMATTKKAKDELTSIDAQIARVGADVRAELSGKGVSDAYIYAVIAQRTKDLNAQRTAAATVYNGSLDNLKMDVEMAQGQYDAFMKGEGVSIDFAGKLYGSQEKAYDKSLGFATSAASKVFGDMQSIAQNEAEFNQKIDQQAKVASDPVIATQSMIDEFKKINVLANRSDAEIIADVKNKVASGMSIGQALSELKAAYMSKPEYKEWARANQTGQVTEREKLEIQQKNELQRMGIQNAYDLKKLATQQQYNNLVSEKDQMKFYQDMLNSGATVSGARAALRAITGDWKGASGKELADAPDGTMIPSRLAQTTNPNGGMECAEWTNASYGTTFPSSYQGKLNIATEAEGGVGKAMVWKPSNDPRFAEYGHVGVIVGEQGDNWIVKSSNLKGDGHISVDAIPKSTQAQFKTLAGFGGQTTEQPIVPKKADTQTQNQRIATMENARKVIMDKLGGKNFDTVVTAANDITALGKSPNATDKMAVIFKFMKSLDPTSTVRETEYQAAASALGLEGTYESFVEGLKGKNIDPNLMDKYALTAITTALVSARDYKSKRDAVINSYAGMGADVSTVEDLTKVQGMKDVGKEASVLLGKLIDSKQITAQQAEDFLDKFGEFME